MTHTFLLIAALLLNASANILMKIGSGKLGDIKTLPKTELLVHFATNAYIIIGLILFALNVILYTAALSKIPLSIAYPIMTSGGFLIIALVSLFFLKEPISWPQVLGMILIITGITFISFSWKNS